MARLKLMVQALFISVVLCGTATAQGPQGPDASTDARLLALEQQIDALRQMVIRMTAAVPATQAHGDVRIDDVEQQIKVLARKLEIEREQAAEAAKTAPVVRAGREEFTLRSADSAFQLRLRGYLHSDSRIYLQDRTNAADAFVLRRVRPILEGTVFRQFDFRVMPDFGGGTTVLQDAYLDARFHPLLRVRAGKFKSPVGLERLASATELLFIERALPTALVPNRDVGIAIHGDWRTGTLTYMGGVFNGVADGASLDGDDQDGKDVAGRVFAHPFSTHRRVWLQGLGVGVSGSYGIQRGTLTAPNLPTFRTAGQQAFFRFRFDGTEAGTALADGAHARVSGQGYYYLGSGGVVVEHVLSSQRIRRSTTGTRVSNTAWQVAGSYVLTGEKLTARGVSPAHPFDRATGYWGAVEIATRYSALDADDGAFPFFANPASAARKADAWAVGTNWYLNPSVKFSLDYERTKFTGGAANGNRATEHDVLGRFQISF